jgi:membrane protease YdiL (CAAX protease family)
MSDRELAAHSSVSGALRPAPVASRALWPVFVAYLVAFLLVLVAGTVYVFVVAIRRSGWDLVRLADAATNVARSAPGLLGVALVSAVTLALVTLAAAWLMGRDVAARLNLRPTRARPLGVAAAVVGLAGLSLACGSAAQLAGLGKEGVSASIAATLRSSNPLRMTLAVLVLGVAPALAEEGFFRGLMLTRLRARWSRWPAIVVTAAAFGVFHVDPVQGSEAFVAGLFFGWVVERLGGIRPTIVAHAVNNGMFVLVASLARNDDEPTRVAALGMLAAGVALCGGAIALLRSRYAASPA